VHYLPILDEKDFFSLLNWKLILEFEEKTTLSTDEELKKIIETENDKGFIVITEKLIKNTEGNSIKVKIYKKHATSIIKSIIIGKFSVLEFSKFKIEINELVDQIDVLKTIFDLPQYQKYSLQKKLYFGK